MRASGQGCVKTPARFHTDLFCSLFRAPRSLGSEKIANNFAPRDCLQNFAEFSHGLGRLDPSPSPRRMTVVGAFRPKTGAEAAGTQAKPNVCSGERTMLLPTTG